VLALGAVAAPAFGGPVARNWSFLPPLRPAFPAVERLDRVSGTIDAFVESALEAHGLTLSPEADRATLARRVTQDLTGLPPLPEEVDRFVADESPDAYARLVDRLLASPRFGEKWGGAWLDAAGYADSNGYFSADSVRPLAYKYRDYVLRSLNADKPFDRFIEEQIAGDELVSFDAEGDLLPGAVDALTATHFLRNSQDGTGESDGNEVEVLIDKVSVIDGAVQIVGSCLLGLTLQCSRCHDHKFDPLLQSEYYGLQAILAPAYSTSHWRKPAERTAEVGTRAERETHHQAVAKVEQEIQARRASLDGFLGPLRKLLQKERIAGLPEPERNLLEKALAAPKDKASAEAKALLQKHEKLVEVSDDDLAQRFPEAARVRSEVSAAIEKLEKERPSDLERLSILWDVDRDPAPFRVLNRGLVTDPGETVEPGVPQALTTLSNAYALDPRVRPGGSTGRRLAFARWLTSNDNPLVARVTVNRIWQAYFGAGIVATPENFGANGAKPTHPELLDHLALELMRGRAGLKAIHRAIVLSSVYRQSSHPRPEGIAADPPNRWLWKFPAKRLEAEAVRDGMLAVAGELDGAVGGPPVATRVAEDGQIVVDEDRAGSRRRSLYLEHRRTQPLTMLEVFDAPLIVTSCTRRTPSTTPLQSLTLLNSEFVLRRARAFAARVRSEAGDDAAACVERVYRLALGREPTVEERALSLGYLAESARPAARGEERASPDSLEGLCQVRVHARQSARPEP